MRIKWHDCSMKLCVKLIVAITLALRLKPGHPTIFTLEIGQRSAQIGLPTWLIMPFFQRMGFAVVEQQTVPCRGETLINYVMEKFLDVSI